MTEEPQSSTFDQLLESWSLNGTRYLHSSYPNWFRVFWFVLLMAMVIAMIFQTLELTKQYRGNPVLHETNFSKKEAQAFPNIMICFPKVIDPDSIAQNYGESLSQALQDAKQPIDYDTLRSIFDGYTNHTHQRPSTNTNHSSSGVHPNHYPTFYDAIRPIDFQLSACFYDGVVGQNMATSCMEQAQHIGPPKDTCYGLTAANVKSKDDSIVRSLHIQIRTRRHNPITIRGSKRPGQIAVIYFYNYFSPNFDKIYIFNQSNVEIPVKIEKYINMVDFTKCEDAVDMETFRKERSCFQQYSLDTVFEQCGCKMMWGSPETSNCTTLHELFCVDTNIDQITEHAGSNCFLHCFTTSYVTPTRYTWNAAAYPEQKFIPVQEYKSYTKPKFLKIPTGNVFELRNGRLSNDSALADDSVYDWSKITIFYSDLTAKTVTRRISYNFWRLASDIGGTLALYMGCCIAAMIELLFSFTRIEDRIRRSKRPHETIGALAQLVVTKFEPTSSAATNAENAENPHSNPSSPSSSADERDIENNQNHKSQRFLLNGIPSGFHSPKNSPENAKNGRKASQQKREKSHWL